MDMRNKRSHTEELSHHPIIIDQESFFFSLGVFTPIFIHFYAVPFPLGLTPPCSADFVWMVVPSPPDQGKNGDGCCVVRNVRGGRRRRITNEVVAKD